MKFRGGPKFEVVGWGGNDLLFLTSMSYELLLSHDNILPATVSGAWAVFMNLPAIATQM